MANVKDKTNDLIERIKELVKEGNVTRIRIKKGDKEVNIPLTAGVVGVFIGVAAVPWAMIVGAIAMIGLDCKVEIEKADGEVTVIEGSDEESEPEEFLSEDGAEPEDETEEVLDEDAEEPEDETEEILDEDAADPEDEPVEVLDEDAADPEDEPVEVLDEDAAEPEDEPEEVQE